LKTLHASLGDNFQYRLLFNILEYTLIDFLQIAKIKTKVRHQTGWVSSEILFIHENYEPIVFTIHWTNRNRIVKTLVTA
jgi:hypothetical protein